MLTDFLERLWNKLNGTAFLVKIKHFSHANGVLGPCLFACADPLALWVEIISTDVRNTSNGYLPTNLWIICKILEPKENFCQTPNTDQIKESNCFQVVTRRIITLTHFVYRGFFMELSNVVWNRTTYILLPTEGLEFQGFYSCSVQI